MRKSKIKIIKYDTYIFAQGAESTPPLGTVLGNLGISAVKFSKEFNDYTKDLPSYFLLHVDMIIELNKGYSFSIRKDLPISNFINMLKTEKEVQLLNGNVILEESITMKEIIQICKFKFPYLELEKSVPMVLGMLSSFNLVIHY
jgi:ribosomal protein L11